MRYLVTGIEGFVGSHLAELLLAQGAHVCGLVWNLEQTANLAVLRPHLELFQGDLRDRDMMNRVVAEARPDAIIHLAAMSSVAASFKDPETTFAINLNGSLNLLEAVRSLPTTPRILIVGSSEMYGPVSSGLPITEDQPLRPHNPYAVSKAAQEMLARQYAASYGQLIICARPFNHTGPRQTADFVCPSFARQIAELERRGGGVIRVGNLDAERDFTDVRDIVRGYVDLIHAGQAGEAYNVCSGRAVSIGRMLDTLLNLTNAEIAVQQDPARMRPSDVPRFLGNAAKLRTAAGWQPAIPLEQTLRDVLEDWRAREAQA